jgi:hypothetical protein
MVETLPVLFPYEYFGTFGSLGLTEIFLTCKTCLHEILTQTLNCFLSGVFRGGAGDNGGRFGEEGTMTGKKCPKGLYGTFCLVSLLVYYVVVTSTLSIYGLPLANSAHLLF